MGGSTFVSQKQERNITTQTWIRTADELLKRVIYPADVGWKAVQLRDRAQQLSKDMTMRGGREASRRFRYVEKGRRRSLSREARGWKWGRGGMLEIGKTLTDPLVAKRILETRTVNETATGFCPFNFPKGCAP